MEEHIATSSSRKWVLAILLALMPRWLVNAQSEMKKQVPLPLIVVIVDELADLMMVASKVEDIIRLGQKAHFG